MNILFLGDIVAKVGREVVFSHFDNIKKEYNIDIAICNGENSAHGKGITLRIYNSFKEIGIDYITMGNHTYSKSEINEDMEYMPDLIVPYNHSLRTTNNYYKLVEYNNIRFIITNILGNVLMPLSNSDPFEAFNNILIETESLNPDFYLVDLHAETTSTKILFANYFKDKAKIVIGTHTHVQTADERLIDNCAYITDVGMCGAYDSIIGRDIDESILANIKHQKTHYTVANGEGILQAVVINVDELSKNPLSIKRIQIRPN